MTRTPNSSRILKLSDDFIARPPDTIIFASVKSNFSEAPLIISLIVALIVPVSTESSILLKVPLTGDLSSPKHLALLLQNEV